MNNKERIELYKEIYFHELDRSHKITRLASVLVTLTVFLISGCMYIGNLFIKNICFSNWFVFAPPLLLIIIGIIFIFLIFYGEKYYYIPDNLEIDMNKFRDYYDDPYYSKLSENEKKEKIESQFEQFLIDYFIKANSTNIDKNDKKRKKFNIALTINMFVLFFLFFLYVINV